MKLTHHRTPPGRRAGTTRTRRLAAGLGVVPAAVTVTMLTATSAGAAPAGVVTPQQGAADHAGSGIAAHERTPDVITSQGATAKVSGLPGLDVSGYQPGINWTTVKNDGAKFAYMKATEGTTYQNPEFSNQYSGSYNVGLVRGAYHFARPDSGSGAAQADYFFANGGGWSADGQTLPGMLDIEYAPSGDTCYGLSQSAMVSWIGDFLNEYHAKSTRWATIYTTTNWWTQCTGNYGGFGANDPLFIARYSSSAGTLPAGWGFYTFWQYADSGTFPGDQDVFNGTADRLMALANNSA